MKTIDEELNGLCVLLECPNPDCGHHWNQKVIEDVLHECPKNCGVNLTIEMLPLNEAYTTFMVNPETLNAAALRSAIMSKKINKDLTNVHCYAPTINN
jgi:hypothetical protein